ncbi:MAG: hypothetical protein ACOC1H_00585, partial [Desulfosalsimonas sp.]
MAIFSFYYKIIFMRRFVLSGEMGGDMFDFRKNQFIAGQLACIQAPGQAEYGGFANNTGRSPG